MSKQVFPPLHHIHKGEGEWGLFHFGFKFKVYKTSTGIHKTHAFCTTIYDQSQATVEVLLQIPHP